MQPGLSQLRGRPAFISGGTSGIGLALARRAAAEGASIVAFSVDDEARRDDARAAIKAARADAAQIVQTPRVDVADPEAVASCLGAACHDLGAPALVVHSAGIGGAAPFDAISDARFDASMQVNVAGMRHMAAACLPAMRAAGRGTILGISSFSGLVGSYGYTAYAASKFALVGLMDALRAECAPQGIAVAVACPVQVDTPMLRQTNVTKPPETLALNANVGVMTADEVTDAIWAGLARGDFLIIPGRKGRMIHWLNRLAPGLRERLSARVIQRVRQQGISR